MAITEKYIFFDAVRNAIRIIEIERGSFIYLRPYTIIEDYLFLGKL